MPDPLPADVFTTAQVREFDRIAIEELGIPGYELMCRAGAALLEALRERFPAAARLAVVCGGGNNGGDGYVVARLAAEAGLDARVLAAADPDTLQGDAAQAWQAAVAAGVAILPFGSDDAGFESVDVIVDALLGTGLTRPVEGPFAAAIAAMNAASAPVVAADLPSGLDGDDGGVHGVAVRATLTVTFVGLKAGLFLGAAPDCRGDIAFASLGIPPDVMRGAPVAFSRVTRSALLAELPPRPPSAHKGSNGRVLLVGGAPGFSGAIRLAAEASLRAGVGLAQVATHPDCVSQVMAGRPELMCRPVQSPADLEPLLAVADAMVLGPGLGMDRWGDSLFDCIVHCELPLVVDADGLNRLAASPVRRGDWLLTPHPGEASRLLGVSTRRVQADRLAAVRGIAERFGASVILKGACSLIAEVSDGTKISCFVCDRGNPGMATAGMGDVLAGVAGSLSAQRRGTAGAAKLAALIHALAGDDAALGGQRGMLAGDLLPFIRAHVNPS